MQNNLFKNALLLVAAMLVLISGLQADPPARLILNGAYINIVQGARLVIDNPSANAITRISGRIISEGENNIVRWNIGTTTGNYIIPWGNNMNYFPLSFTPTAAVGNGYFNFSTYPTPWNNSSQLPSGITTINNGAGNDNSAFVIDRFWQLDARAYTTKPILSNLLFTYVDAEHSAPGNTITESNLRAQRYNDVGMTWSDYPPSGTINTSANTVVVASLAPVDLYKWWTLVDQSSPLPVTLLAFTAEPEGQQVKLNWVTKTEVNNDYFTVERSQQGLVFEPVVEIDGAGLSTQELRYTALDYNPFAGLSYYRLRQTDFDGKNTYTSLVSVRMGQDAGLLFNIYPNPDDGRDLSLTFSNITGGSIQVKIYSLTGQEMFGLLIPSTPGTEFTSVIDLPETLPAGAYFIKIDSDNQTKSQNFILQNR